MKEARLRSRFVICLSSHGADDLEARKLYEALPDRSASREGYLRIVDESGEDYLYPAEYFAPVKLPASVTRKLAPLSRAGR